MPLHHHIAREREDDLQIRPQFAQPGETTSVPKLRLPEGELPPDTAYQVVHDELVLVGSFRPGTCGT